MKSVAYKWRISTTEYVYITSTKYNKYNPNYFLGDIYIALTPEEENIIIENVKSMDRETYHKCFNHVLNITKNYDINLKNWEYYYDISREGCIDCGKETLFYSGATATAEVSHDDNAYVDVDIDNGILNFSFLIPRGLDGKDGEKGNDGLPGTPGKDGSFYEYIYLLTKINDYGDLYQPSLWYENDPNYIYDAYIPYGWTDKPSGINDEYKYEWVSLRKKDETGKWGIFSEPKLMSRWGENGKDGDGIEYIYTLTTDDNAPILEIPVDWETNSEYQSLEQYVNRLKNWTDSPSGISLKYKYEWVAIRKQKNGVWQPFIEPKIWARWGEDGNGIEYIYCITQENEKPTVPQITENNFQNSGYYSGIWSDTYVEPTNEYKYAWVSTRKYKDNVWGEFSEPNLWNTYKIGGKAFIDIYARSNVLLNWMDLPQYENDLFYSFEYDKFYTDISATNEVTTLNGNVTWYTDMPNDIDLKYLHKATAKVILNEDITELVKITKNNWYGPYLIASNGENGTNKAPYIIFDDDSLSIPVKEKTYLPHENYQYSFNVMLYFNDSEQIIKKYNVKASDENKINIIDIIPISNAEGNINKYNIKFNIDNTKAFNTIEVINVTLEGDDEEKTFEATAQFKIIPYTSEEAILYKIVLNKDILFIPSDPCSNETKEEIWNENLVGQVEDNRGNVIELSYYDELLYEDNSGITHDFKNGITLYACGTSETVPNDTWVNIETLPNPLPIIYKSNGVVREIEYVNFVNMPSNGIDGLSSKIVFAYTSTNEGETPETPIGGSVDFKNNTIVYPEDPSGKFLWGRISELNNVVWFSQSEFFSDGTKDLIWSTPLRLTGFKGAGSAHIELSNDSEQVYTTDGNVVVRGQTVETIVSLMDGTNKMPLTLSNITANSEYFTCVLEAIDEYNVKVIAELNTTSLLNINNIDINIIINNGDDIQTQLLKIFKIRVLNGTLDFDLDVTPTIIKYDKNNVASHTQISVNINKRDIATDAITIEKVNNWSEYGLTVFYYLDDKQNTKKQLKDTSITVPNANFEKITIILVKDRETIDTVFIESVRDGKDGENGKDGINGKLLYPAGKWDSNAEYDGSDKEKTPFVLYEDKYYVLTANYIVTGDEVPGSSAAWTEMQKYEAIYTDLIVAENGLVGGSVYNSDYVFSKTGKQNNNITDSYSAFTSDVVDKIFSGRGSTATNSFIPNYLVDFNKGRAWFGAGETVINEKGTIFSRDIIDIIHEIAIPYPSGNTSSNGWDKIETGYESTELPIEKGEKIYIKTIENLNVFVHDNYQLTGDTCPEGLIFLNVSLPEDLLPMKDIWYKGSILLGNTCAASKIIRFPYYKVKYNFNIYNGINTLYGNKLGIHIGSGGVLNYLYKPSEKAIEIIGSDSTCYSDITKPI